MRKVMLAGAATVLAVVGGAPAAAAHPAAARTVNVKVDEFHIGTSRAVGRGRVTFVVRNTGHDVHEFVVLRTGRSARALGTAGHGRAAESGHVAEIPNLRPGQTKRLTVTLRPGHYSLVCNLPGHYMAGMYADLRAT